VTGSAEFKLAIECCRSSFRNFADRGAVPTPAEVDWARFLDLARFHRVEGLAWNYLSAKETGTPEDVRATLSQAASGIAAQNLRASADCRILLEAFEAAKVPLLFLKGQTLGALAYTNPALKSAIDVDVLIDAQDLELAATLLHATGSELVLPRGAGPERLRAWHRTNKESVWLRNAVPLQLDLHTRAADNPRLIPGINVHSPSQRVAVDGNLKLPTLATDELFAYLAVHGASSAWFRLKWIADFAGFLSGRGADEIERLFRRSKERGAGRAPGQALLLADALFGTLRGLPALRRELESEFGTRQLFRAALCKLTGTPREPTQARFGTFTIHWTQLLLEPDFAFKLAEVRRQARQAIARRTWR
jgi:hypothetical protein